MKRVCFITLTDVRNDMRIRKEAGALAQSYDLLVLSCMPGSAGSSLEMDGFRVRNISISTKKLPKSPIFWMIKYLEFLMKSLFLARSFRADVYHGHEVASAVPAYLASLFSRAVFIYDAHELELDREGAEHRTWIGGVMRLWVKFLLRRADHVICASPERADIMLKDYGVRELPTPIINVTPRVGLADGAEVQLPAGLSGSDHRIILYQGVLIPGRGILNLVRAMKSLPETYKLMIVGGGESPERYQEQAKSDGTNNRIFFIGRVPFDQIKSCMQKADLGVVTYRNTCRNNYYCAPNKLYEYSSVGLPVVGPDFPGIRGLVDTYGLGCVFDPEDPESIAGAIVDVLKDPDLYEKMKKSTADLKTHFNWEQQAEKLQALYSDFLDEGA